MGLLDLSIAKMRPSLLGPRSGKKGWGLAKCVFLEYIKLVEITGNTVCELREGSSV
jgi:hypothetical protein